MMAAEEQRWTEEHTRRALDELPASLPGLIHLNSAGCSLPSRATLNSVQEYLTRCAAAAAARHCRHRCRRPPLPPPPAIAAAAAVARHCRRRCCGLPRTQCECASLTTPNPRLHARSEATIGGYETFDAEAEALRCPYTALAALLNCRPDEIAIVSSATAAWQQVVYGLAWGWRRGDRVLVSVAEYGSSVIGLLQLAKCARGLRGGCAAQGRRCSCSGRRLQARLRCLTARPRQPPVATRRRTGIVIEVIPETPAGDVDLAALRALLAQGPRPPVLVAISHVPTSSGACCAAPCLLLLCAGMKHLPVLLHSCRRC